MTEIEDNPYASPHVESLVETAPNINAIEWFVSPTRRGPICGGYTGLILFAVLLFVAMATESGPTWMKLLAMPIYMLFGAAVGGLLGGISGILVGLIAIMVRRFRWRTEMQFFACATICPTIFAGAFSLFLGSATDFTSLRIKMVIFVVAVIGLGIGLYLFAGLHSVAKYGEDRRLFFTEPPR